MGKAVEQRYQQTRQALREMLQEHPHGIYLTAITQGNASELLHVSVRGATRDERTDPARSPMPAGITGRRQIQESPEAPIHEITFYIGPGAHARMPRTGFPFEGVADGLLDNAVKHLGNSTERQQRHSA